MQKEIKEALKISETTDERGFPVYFEDFSVKHFHIVSVEPGATRGNHVHKYNEVICVIGGKNSAQPIIRLTLWPLICIINFHPYRFIG